MAIKLGELNANVVVNYVLSDRQAEEVAMEIAAMGGQAVPVKADMRSIGDIETLLDAAIEKFGALDILINNAGTVLTNRLPT